MERLSEDEGDMRREAGLRPPKAKGKESKSRQNFKVMIRVRPPLDVEIEREQSIYRRINEDGHMRLSAQMRSHCEPGPSVVVEKNKEITLFEGGVNLWQGNHAASGLLNMYKFTFDTVLPPQVRFSSLPAKELLTLLLVPFGF